MQHIKGGVMQDQQSIHTRSCRYSIILQLDVVSNCCQYGHYPPENMVLPLLYECQSCLANIEICPGAGTPCPLMGTIRPQTDISKTNHRPGDIANPAIRPTWLRSAFSRNMALVALSALGQGRDLARKAGQHDPDPLLGCGTLDERPH